MDALICLIWNRYHSKTLIPRYKTDERANNLYIDYNNNIDGDIKCYSYPRHSWSCGHS